MSEQIPEYDVCLSFAGEDRSYVERVAESLKQQRVRVFYDQFEEAALWGKDLIEHLDYIYRRAARYCVVFVSRSYKEKAWTRHEHRSAQARAFEQNEEYILPARFDNTELEGLRPTVGFIDLQNKTPENFANLIVRKLDSHTGGAENLVGAEGSAASGPVSIEWVARDGPELAVRLVNHTGDPVTLGGTHVVGLEWWSEEKREFQRDNRSSDTYITGDRYVVDLKGHEERVHPLVKHEGEHFRLISNSSAHKPDPRRVPGTWRIWVEVRVGGGQWRHPLCFSWQPESQPELRRLATPETPWGGAAGEQSPDDPLAYDWTTADLEVGQMNTYFVHDGVSGEEYVMIDLPLRPHVMMGRPFVRIALAERPLGRSPISATLVDDPDHPLGSPFRKAGASWDEQQHPTSVFWQHGYIYVLIRGRSIKPPNVLTVHFLMSQEPEVTLVERALPLVR